MSPVVPRISTAKGRARDDDANAILEREYESLRGEVVATVRGKLRSAGIQLDDSDIDAAYNQAWHALYVKLEEGQAVDNRAALLVTIAHRRAIDEHRALHVDRRADDDGTPDLPAPLPDVDGRLDDERRLRSLVEGMRERLSGRELQAATLCYLHERSRPEAAEIMGLSPRRMEKVMDRVSKQIAEIVRDVQGDWCRSRGSLIRAYALGVLDPEGERYRLAASHLEDCSACRRRVLALRGLAAATPPAPMLALLLGGGVAVAGGGGAVAAGGAAAGGGAVAGGGAAAGHTAAAGGAGAAGGGGAGGGAAAGGGAFGAQTIAIAVAGVVAVGGIAAAATGAIGGGDPKKEPARPAAVAPATTATPTPVQPDRSAELAAARAEARQRAAARARARKRAVAKRAAAARAAQAKANAQAPPATTATTPPVTTPAVPPPTQPASPPNPPPTSYDGGEEFKPAD